MKAKITVRGTKVTIEYMQWPDEAMRFRLKLINLPDNKHIMWVGTRGSTEVIYIFAFEEPNSNGMLLPGDSEQLSCQHNFHSKEEAKAVAKEAAAAINIWVRRFRNDTFT
jgi:hypothetical protein